MTSDDSPGGPVLLGDEPDERVRHLALHAQVGLALAANDAVGSGLRACSASLVRHLGAAFARVWVLGRDRS